MVNVTVNINTIDKVKHFVNAVAKFPCDFDLTSTEGKYVIDAKSVMGVLSLDLSKNLNLAVHSTQEYFDNDIKPALDQFIVS